MAEGMRQKVRFTGGRTGLDSIKIKNVGRVAVGDEFEVSADEADRLTALLPMRHNEMGSDFVRVGGASQESENEAIDHELAERDAYLERITAKPVRTPAVAHSRAVSVKTRPAKARTRAKKR